jgi:hypothetical protein
MADRDRKERRMLTSAPEVESQAPSEKPVGKVPILVVLAMYVPSTVRG